MVLEVTSDGPEDGGLLLNSGQVRARLGRISAMALWRWRNDSALRFPRPLTINKRNYWRSTELAAWIDDRGQTPPAAPRDGAST